MKKGLAAAAAVLALAVLAYTAAWFYGANRFEQAIADWKAEAEASGVSITHDEFEICGYPFALTTVLRDLKLHAKAEGASLEAAPIQLSTNLWNPNRIQYDFAGKHVFTGTQGSQTRAVAAQATVDVETGGGEAEFDGDRREDRMVAMNVEVISQIGIVTIARLEASGIANPKPADGTSDSFQAVYALNGVEATDPLGVKLLEPPIEKLRLDLAATGPFVELLKGGTVLDWASAGGTLALRDLTVEWNGFAFTASGNVGFDTELRPTGSVTLVSTSFGESLQSLEEKGVIAPDLALWIRQLTEPFVVPFGDGSRSDLVVPITAADGILSLGGQPMMPIPSLEEL
ncbi:MAG: DUF2125 domain-containing protein [Rhodospirillales bacterium]|nr:DUF2125 domain-containing protein [Rhodospirillales bacterium]